MKSVFNPPLEDVLKVLLDSEIYDRITDDTDPPKEKLGKANLSGWSIIAGYKEEIASLFMVKEGQLHFYVLPSFRKYARAFLKQALKMYAKPVFCEVPTLYPETINFAKRSGFIEAGIRRNAHMKNGKQYDLVRLEWVV